jgi:hypothetical protein
MDETNHTADRAATNTFPEHVRMERPTFTVHGTTEAFCKLLVEMSAAKTEFDKLKKNKLVSYHDAKGKLIQYPYSPIADLDAVSQTALAKHGIGVAFLLTRPDEDTVTITALVAGHGVILEYVAQLYGASDIKDMGGLTTYMRRYMWQCLFSVEGDRDADEIPKDELPRFAPKANPGTKPASPRNGPPPPRNQPLPRPEPRPEPKTDREASPRPLTEPPADGGVTDRGSTVWRNAMLADINSQFDRLSLDAQRVKAVLRQALETDSPPRSKDLTTDQVEQLHRYLSQLIEDAGV